MAQRACLNQLVVADVPGAQNSQQFSRIHDLVRVKRAFDTHHHLQLNGRLAVLELIAPQLTYAVLCADAALEVGHLVMNRPVEK